MKLKLVMKDREYRDALARAIGRQKSNLYVIIEDNFNPEEDSLIVTDVGQGKLREGMVYLGREDDRRIEGSGPYTLFKYESVEALIRDLSLCCYLWCGNGEIPDSTGYLITTGTMNRPDLCEELAESLAAELAKRIDGRVLLIPLTYFYIGSRFQETEESVIRKLLYYIQMERKIPLEPFFRREEGNVYRLRMTEGMNELLRMPENERVGFIRQLGRYFPVVICNLGDCYSEGNIQLMQNADRCIYMVPEEMKAYFPKTADFVPEGELAELSSLSNRIVEELC